MRKENASYIGSWRMKDNREHFDRSMGRPAPQDFIVKIKDDEIKIIPDLNETIKKKILLALNLIIGTKQRLPALEEIGGLSVQIYQKIKGQTKT